MALIDNKNQQVSMLTRKILQKILHVNEKTNFRQWWMEHEATFSFDDYLINIITDKSRSTEDRVACIFHIRVQALSGNDKIGEASLCKISSILLDSSEPEGLRLSAYACLSDMVKDHSATHPTDLSWKNVLIKPAVSLFDKEVFYRTIRFMTPAEAITGDLRDKFKAAALDDKLPPARRASAINVLGRGCAVYKEHRVEDAKLALSVLDDYSRSDKEIESFLHPKSRGAQAAIKTTHAQIVCLALESMTGRKDCGYDIEKWRKAVAELAAKAGRPEQR